MTYAVISFTVFIGWFVYAGINKIVFEEDSAAFWILGAVSTFLWFLTLPAIVAYKIGKRFTKKSS